jgi:hypothetical protein
MTDERFAFLNGQADALLKLCDALVELHPNKAGILKLMQDIQTTIDVESSPSAIGQQYKNGHKKVVATLEGDTETLVSLSAQRQNTVS